MSVDDQPKMTEIAVQEGVEASGDPINLASAVDGQKNPAAQALGRLGGKKRALNTSPERRVEIARIAAKRRWEKP